MLITELLFNFAHNKIRISTLAGWRTQRKFYNKKNNYEEKNIYFAAILCIGMVSSIIATAKSSHSEIMTKKADGTYIVNTTTLGKDIKGFRGNTPLAIYIKKGKIVEIKALANQETPKFFNKVKQGLLNKWNGMKASKAATVQVDGVTGATYSSNAVKENVKRGVSYYLTHKKGK